MTLTMMSVQALAIIMVEKFFSRAPRVARKMEIMMINETNYDKCTGPGHHHGGEILL